VQRTGNIADSGYLPGFTYRSGINEFAGGEASVVQLQ